MLRRELRLLRRELRRELRLLCREGRDGISNVRVRRKRRIGERGVDRGDQRCNSGWRERGNFSLLEEDLGQGRLRSLGRVGRNGEYEAV